MNYSVAVEAAVQVYEVEKTNEAVQIAISKVGNMINPDLNYVEIETRDQVDGDPAYIVADEALVGLELEMTVFGVEDEEHAERVAKKEIGDRLNNIPLKVVSIEEDDEIEDDEIEDDEIEDDEIEDDEIEQSSSNNTNEDTVPDINDLTNE